MRIGHLLKDIKNLVKQVQNVNSFSHIQFYIVAH